MGYASCPITQSRTHRLSISSSSLVVAAPVFTRAKIRGFLNSLGNTEERSPPFARARWCLLPPASRWNRSNHDCAHYHQLREHEKVQVREGVRFVMHDRIATSAGVTAGIDLALAFVARFFSDRIAQRIAENLEWRACTGATEKISRPEN